MHDNSSVRHVTVACQCLRTQIRVSCTRQYHRDRTLNQAADWPSSHDRRPSPIRLRPSDRMPQDRVYGSVACNRFHDEACIVTAHSWSARRRGAGDRARRAAATPVRRGQRRGRDRQPVGGHAASCHDLNDEVGGVAPVLAHLLTDAWSRRWAARTGSRRSARPRSSGTAGEIEHGGALIHTPYFGNLMREITEGESIIVLLRRPGGRRRVADRADVAQDAGGHPLATTRPSRCGCPTHRVPTRSSSSPPAPPAADPTPASVTAPATPSCGCRPPSPLPNEALESVMNVRKIVTYVDEVLTEGGRPVDPPARTAVVVAVIENPWAGRASSRTWPRHRRHSLRPRQAAGRPRRRGAGRARRGIRQGRDRRDSTARSSTARR